jgi:uncharacterized surface anchored protein
MAFEHLPQPDAFDRVVFVRTISTALLITGGIWLLSVPVIRLTGAWRNAGPVVVVKAPLSETVLVPATSTPTPQIATTPAPHVPGSAATASNSSSSQVGSSSAATRLPNSGPETLPALLVGGMGTSVLGLALRQYRAKRKLAHRAHHLDIA